MARALVVLSPGASRRLIARGVGALPQVERALEEGWVIVTLGTTNAYVAEELLGRPIDKARFCAGYIGPSLGWVPPERRAQPLVLHRGQPVELRVEEAVKELRAGDEGLCRSEPAGAGRGRA